MVLVDRAGAYVFDADVGERQRRAAVENGPRRRSRPDPRRVALRQLAQQRLLLGVAVRARDARRSPFLLEVDDRPVGERLDAQAGQRAEDHFRVERRCHDRGRLAEEAGPALGGLRLHPTRALAFEEERVLEGDRGLRGEQLQRQQALGREDAGNEVVLEIEKGDDLGLPADGQAQHRAGTDARQVRVAGEPARVGGRVVEEHAFVGTHHVLEDRIRQPRVTVRRGRRRLIGAHLRRDLQATLAREEELGAAGTALLEDEEQERAQQLLPDHHARDGL